MFAFVGLSSGLVTLLALGGGRCAALLAALLLALGGLGSLGSRGPLLLEAIDGLAVYAEGPQDLLGLCTAGLMVFEPAGFVLEGRALSDAEVSAAVFARVVRELDVLALAPALARVPQVPVTGLLPIDRLLRNLRDLVGRGRGHFLVRHIFHRDLVRRLKSAVFRFGGQIRRIFGRWKSGRFWIRNPFFQ